MLKPNGVHHLAISTGNMKQQLEFFSDVLGMELVALYWMHGVPNTFHGFVKASDTCYVAFVHNPDIAKLPIQIGLTHAGNAGTASSPGTMQHVAFNVDSQEELLAMRDRIRSRGVNVFGPIDHGMCQSMYFAGPENLSLEISTSREAIDAKHWIDPEVVALNGISAEELARFKAPAEYRNPQGPLPQPAKDPAKPHMVYPEESYDRMLAMSDQDYWDKRSTPTPPVP
jgi:catechol 2,3-dioxygenase-like lactoylglutathione lyase family enzyme